MTKRKGGVAQRTAALADAFPKHSNHDRFLEAAIAARAKDLVVGCPSLTKDQATTTARAEFKAALDAVIYPPTERRFYFIWSSAEQARLLVNYTKPPGQKRLANTAITSLSITKASVQRNPTTRTENE